MRDFDPDIGPSEDGPSDFEDLELSDLLSEGDLEIEDEFQLSDSELLGLSSDFSAEEESLLFESDILLDDGDLTFSNVKDLGLDLLGTIELEEDTEYELAPIEENEYQFPTSVTNDVEIINIYRGEPELTDPTQSRGASLRSSSRGISRDPSEQEPVLSPKLESLISTCWTAGTACLFIAFAATQSPALLCFGLLSVIGYGAWRVMAPYIENRGSTSTEKSILRGLDERPDFIQEPIHVTPRALRAWQDRCEKQLHRLNDLSTSTLDRRIRERTEALSSVITDIIENCKNDPDDIREETTLPVMLRRIVDVAEGYSELLKEPTEISDVKERINDLEHSLDTATRELGDLLECMKRNDGASIALRARLMSRVFESSKPYRTRHMPGSDLDNQQPNEEKEM